MSAIFPSERAVDRLVSYSLLYLDSGLVSCLSTFIRMPLTKECTLCGATVNVKKSVCGCGHIVTLKRKAVATGTRSKKVAMKKYEHKNL